ncbi:beta-lactamase family protein [Nonomuraea sp. NEAU-A123]|nr:beta-lactamase family protein [Nonomuraea sp. NEAU-A123]
MATSGDTHPTIDTAAVACSLVLTLVAPAFAAATPAPQSRLDLLTTGDGMAGALSQVRSPGGASVTRRSGTAERGTGKAMIGPQGRFRIASGSKPIIAATVLRLVDQREIDLDARVERYLPGVLRGTGDGAEIDGREITVRMLLQQTSGLPEFLNAIKWKEPFPDFLKVALTLKPTPRGSFAYANTNYLVLGMIVTAVTGKDFRQASRDLILKPYGMLDTYWPAKGDYGIRGPHAHTYGVHPGQPRGGEVDLTDQLPTYEFGPSGGLVSTRHRPRPRPTRPCPAPDLRHPLHARRSRRRVQRPRRHGRRPSGDDLGQGHAPRHDVRGRQPPLDRPRGVRHHGPSRRRVHHQGRRHRQTRPASGPAREHQPAHPDDRRPGSPAHRDGGGLTMGPAPAMRRTCHRLIFGAFVLVGLLD